MKTNRFSLLAFCLAACLSLPLPVSTDPPDTGKDPYAHLWVVTLSNGDRIIGEVTLSERGDLRLTACFGSIGIVLDFVASISPYKGALVKPQPPRAESARDTVYLRDGCLAEGVVQELTAGKLKLRSDNETLCFERGSIEEISFSYKKEVQKDDRGTQDSLAAVIRLTDGSIITGQILEIARKIARVRAPCLSGEARIPVSCIDSVTFTRDARGEVKEGYNMPETIQPSSPVYKTHLGFIKGRATTDKGVPLTGCFVFFYDLAQKRFYGEDSFFRFIRHSADGWYVSPPLKPGRYAVLGTYHSETDPAGALWIGWVAEVDLEGGRTATADLSLLSIEDRWPGFLKQTIGPGVTEGEADPEVALKPAVKVVPAPEHGLFVAFLRAAKTYQGLFRTIDPEEW